ncbi:MAG: class I SAM-dependent methyltransferase [Marmoricola sp.]
MSSHGSPANGPASSADGDVLHPEIPDDAVYRLTGTTEQRPGTTVLELSAGTGYLTAQLVRLGHRVIATDPSPQNLSKLRARVVPFAVGVSGAEAIPSPSQTVDVVVCNPLEGQYDRTKALSEINRVLRPNGAVALIWITRDEGVPWVRRLGKLIGSTPADHTLGAALLDSDQFSEPEGTSWRTWQRLDRRGLIAFAQASGVSDEGTLAAVGALYDEYDRGPDGLQLPFLIRGLRATVVHKIEENPEPRVVVEPTVAGPLEATEPEIVEPIEPPDEPGTLLIDFT